MYFQSVKTGCISHSLNSVRGIFVTKLNRLLSSEHSRVKSAVDQNFPNYSLLFASFCTIQTRRFRDFLLLFFVTVHTCFITGQIKFILAHCLVVAGALYTKHKRLLSPLPCELDIPSCSLKVKPGSSMASLLGLVAFIWAERSYQRPCSWQGHQRDQTARQHR